MKRMVSISICATLFLAQGVFAGAGHDHGPKHGGVLREVSSISYELVAKADSLTLHVSDHGKPVATAGTKGQVTLYAGNQKTEVVLEPAGDNRMEAKGNFKVGVGVRAVLAITLPGKAEQRTTFNLK